jgi:hypothetical protein
VSQKLNACTLERIRYGWKQDFMLNKDPAPTAPWWRRTVLKLRVDPGSVGRDLEGLKILRRQNGLSGTIG